MLAALLATLCALALGCYSPVLRNWFLRDDFLWLHEAGRQLEDPWRFVTARPVGYLRPFTSLVFSLEYALFGLEPRGYYAVNIGLHAWNAAWLVAISWMLFRDAISSGVAGVLFVASAIWSGAVIWISSITGLLVAATMLPTLAAYSRFLRGGEWRWYAASFVGVVLCVGSKETGTVVGALLLLLEWRERGLRSFTRGATWLRYLPFVLLAIGYVLLQQKLIGKSYFPGVAETIESSLQRMAASIGRMALFKTIPAKGEAVAGAVFVLLLLALLRACGGRDRLREGLWLVLALIAAFLPFAASGGGSGAWISRYLYEPGLFFSLLVARVVGVLAARLRLAVPGPARRLLAAGALGSFAIWIVFQRSDTRAMIVSGHYRGDAAASRRLVEELSARAPPPGERWLLLGLPIEDDAQLRSLGTVFLGLPAEAFEPGELELGGPKRREELLADDCRLLRECLDADLGMVWIDGRGLQPCASEDDPQGQRTWEALQRSRTGKAKRASVWVLAP